MTQNEYKQKWDRCLSFIQNNIESAPFEQWFKPLSFCSYDSNTHELKVSEPSHFFHEFIGQNYRGVLYAAMRREFGNDVRLFFRTLIVSENNIVTDTESDKATPSPKVSRNHLANEAPSTLQSHAPSAELDSHLIDEYSFDNFIQGVSNMLPRSVGMAIAKNPKQTTFNPLFVFGHSGVGKTHLVNAIGRAIKEQHPEKRVLYLSAHLFHVQFVDAIRKNVTNDFIRFYQQIDVLIIDDIHEFVGMEKTQDTFFHIFNHLKQNGKQIILTCDRPPVDLQGMNERLITRFKWGLLAELQQPDEELRRNILINKIHSNGLDIPTDVIDYISKNVTESVRELEGVLNSLMARSVVFNCDVDLNMAKGVVGSSNKAENKPITIDDIIEHACTISNVSKNDVFSGTRKANVVQVRQIAMYLAHKHTGLSTSKIGALIGKRNHTTVIHSVRLITDRLENDKELNKLIAEIETSIRQNK